MNRTNESETGNRVRPYRFSMRMLLVFVSLASVFIAVKRDWLISLVEGKGLDLPADLSFTREHILWSTPVGSKAFGSPVISGNQIFVGTNNACGLLERYPAEVDLGVLMCIDRKTGKFLWQTSTPKGDRNLDWATYGQRGKPIVQDDRLWYIDNRHELVCLDTNGFRDDEDDGDKSELPESPDRLKSADVVWRYDMVKELGITPHDICYVDRGPSVCRIGDVLLCVTGHCQLGVEPDQTVDAPSFIAVNKKTGKLIWADSSSSLGSLGSQTGTPICANLGGTTQAIFPGGDGWLYSFDFKSLKNGKTKLLWKFDCNPKDASWQYTITPKRFPILSQPVIADGYVYATTARYTGGAGEQARIWCIDPTKRGDVSADLVFNQSDLTKPIPDKLPCACDAIAGDTIKPNPNSAAVWHFDGSKQQPFYSSRNKPLIRNGSLVVSSDNGFVTCLDSLTGKHLWTDDLVDSSFGSPIFSSDRVHCAHEGGITSYAIASDGTIASPKKQSPRTTFAPTFVSATPAITDNTLYILTEGRLYAIGKK